MGKSGRAMIEAPIASDTNPAKLASLADRRVKASPEELREALRGRMTKHHRFPRFGGNQKTGNYLQAQFHRSKARRGPKKAITALAASILAAIRHKARLRPPQSLFRRPAKNALGQTAGRPGLRCGTQAACRLSYACGFFAGDERLHYSWTGDDASSGASLESLHRRRVPAARRSSPGPRRSCRRLLQLDVVGARHG